MENLSEDTLGHLIPEEDTDNSIKIAYIKPLSLSGSTGYAVHSPDGTQLAVFPSYESAFFTARQHNLEPLSVH